MRLPVMVSCRMFWISASLSCPLRVVLRTCRPIFLDEYRMTGTNSSSTQASLLAQQDDHSRRKKEGKELLQEFRHHRSTSQTALAQCR